MRDQLPYVRAPQLLTVVQTCHPRGAQLRGVSREDLPEKKDRDERCIREGRPPLSRYVYLVIELDHRLDPAENARRPKTLLKALRRARKRGALLDIHSLGEDVLDGRLELCACNTWRYEHGHMESCPLHGHRPEVVAIDTRG